MPGKSAADSPAEKNRRAIVAAIGAIPRGQVAGYGEVARRAGLPGRARLVARLLAQNDDPALPWHRVLRSDGRIAFPEGSSQRDEQAQRLRAEGVRVEQGRVRGQRAAASLDEILWAPPVPAAAPRAGGRRGAGTTPPRSAAAGSPARPRVRPRR